MPDRQFNPLISSDAVKSMIDRGLLPPGTTRFVIDSGGPGEVVRIWWEGFADTELVELLAEHMAAVPPHEKKAVPSIPLDDERSA